MRDKKKDVPTSSNPSENVPRGTTFATEAERVHLGVLLDSAMLMRLELDKSLRAIEQYVGHDINGLDKLIDELAGTSNGSDAEALQMLFALATRAAAPRATTLDVEEESFDRTSVRVRNPKGRPINTRGGQ